MPLNFIRCGDCGLIHLTCGICGAKRTIQKESDMIGDRVLLGEDMAVGQLKWRSRWTGIDCFICDRCWPAVREQRIPKIDPNGYVKPLPKIFVMG